LGRCKYQLPLSSFLSMKPRQTAFFSEHVFRRHRERTLGSRWQTLNPFHIHCVGVFPLLPFYSLAVKWYEISSDLNKIYSLGARAFKASSYLFRIHESCSDNTTIIIFKVWCLWL
jgi:hypothetical protein